MKTVEAAYVVPIVISIILFSIMTCLSIHDAVVGSVLQYGFLVKQASLLEDDYYMSGNELTKKDIEEQIYGFYLTEDKPSLSCTLSGKTLYILNTSKENSLPTFFSNFERCDSVRKETALFLQYINNDKNIH